MGLGREGEFLHAKSNTGETMWVLQEKPSSGARHELLAGCRGWAPGWWSEVLVWSMSQCPSIPTSQCSPRAHAWSSAVLGNIGTAGLCGRLQSLTVCPVLEPSCTIFQLLYEVEQVVREKERKQVKKKPRKTKQHSCDPALASAYKKSWHS